MRASRMGRIPRGPRHAECCGAHTRWRQTHATAGGDGWACSGPLERGRGLPGPWPVAHRSMNRGSSDFFHACGRPSTLMSCECCCTPSCVPQVRSGALSFCCRDQEAWMQWTPQEGSCFLPYPGGPMFSLGGGGAPFPARTAPCLPPLASSSASRSQRHEGEIKAELPSARSPLWASASSCG